MENIMRSFESNNVWTFLLLPVLAAFAVQVHAAQAADAFGDTESQVRAVLEGARTATGIEGQSTSSAAVHLMDVPESTRGLLLGTHDFEADRSVVRTASERGDLHDRDIQKHMQRVILGPAAS